MGIFSSLSSPDAKGYPAAPPRWDIWPIGRCRAYPTPGLLLPSAAGCGCQPLDGRGTRGSGPLAANLF